MSWTVAEIRELREGGYLVVDDEPCKILSIQMSKPGKHGEAKARMDVMGLFDGRKRSVVHPVTHKVQVPMIDKRKGQIISVTEDHAQVMDSETYAMSELILDDEWKGKVKPGQDCLLMSVLGKVKLMQVTGGN